MGKIKDLVPSNNNRDLPIFIQFDETEAIGTVKLRISSYPLLVDCVLVPSIRYQDDHVIVDSYSFVPIEYVKKINNKED